MKTHGFCVYLIFCFANVKANIGGYYWREYTGEIPEDALVAGSDINGKPVYVGQTLFQDKLEPGYIKESDSSKMYFEWFDVEKHATKNIKILCTQEPEKMEWVVTKNYEVHLLTNRHFILGGFEPDCTIYIGRVNVAGETLPGKVVNLETSSLGLYVTSDGKGKNFLSFEILTYNANATRTLPIDVLISEGPVIFFR